MKLGNIILTLLFASFVGIMANPEMPFASDSVAVTGLSNAGVTETVVLPEPEPEPEPEEPEEEPTYIETSYSEPAYEEPVYYAPADNITINGRTIKLAYTETTAENAGGATQAWYYKTGKFIYGHNSWNVFGFLNSAYDGGWLDGMSFSVTMGEVTSYYTVSDYHVYDYESDKLWNDGEMVGMGQIVNPSNCRMVIMTCYAGGSQRLVIFAK